MMGRCAWPAILIWFSWVGPLTIPACTHMVQYAGKAATVPWETGAALREVYAAANQSNSSEEEEGGMEGAHARCLAPVMLAGGDSLCAALRALEAAGEEGEGEEKAAGGWVVYCRWVGWGIDWL